jgi:GTP-binding protein EngB required for normal cell division
VAPGQPPEGHLFALLEYARDLCARTPELASLLPAAARAAEAFDRPLLIAVMGEFNAGKSSFVNAFCGAEVAPVGVTPTTATVNVLRYGPAGGRVLYHDGRAEDLAAEAVSPFLGGLTADDAAAVRMVEIFFPLDVLRRVEMVDTPGLNSLRPEHEKVARAFLTEADALVWLFAVGQAAKASEGEALTHARAAGKRVLGVLSKADQADARELEQVAAHVRASMGARIEALVPLSARDAVRARRSGDERLLAASGLPALLAVLEERYFGDARALKRQTALAALARFVREAGAHADPARPADDFEARRKGLAAARTTLEGALAAERVGLRARLEASFRQAAAEVLEFVRPRHWIFGERRAESADEDFLFDLLEDAVAQGTEATRRALEAAAAGGPPVPIASAVDRFRAYARGILAGGLVEQFLHEQLPAAGGRVEVATLQRSLARRIPDVEGELFVPLAAEIRAAHARAQAALAEDELRATMRALLRETRLTGPLAALDRALADVSDRAA